MIRKNLSYKQMIEQLFNFQYAGFAYVFITMTRNKYTVCSSGFEIVDDIVFFKKEKTFIRKSYNDLYGAIITFNYIVRCLVESLDWYHPDLYKDIDSIKSMLNDKYVY